MRELKILLGFTLILIFSASGAQARKSKKLGFFQRNRSAFEKAKYGQTTKKYGKACTIFEKKRTRGEKKPFLSFGSKRRSKNRKVAEQN